MLRDKKSQILIVTLAIVSLIISFGTDVFIREYTIFNVNTTKEIVTLIVNKLIAFLLYLVLWSLALYIAKKIKEKDKKTLNFLQVFIVYFTINIILLILTWPGIWRFDEFKILACVKNYELEYWQHYLTSVFYNLALMIIPMPTGVIIAQIAVISAIVAYIISSFKGLFKNKKIANILYVPFLLLPLLDANLYPIRLSIYTYIELLLVCQLIFMANKEEYTNKDVAILLASLILLSVWRSEGILFIALIPIICIFFLKKRFPQVLDRIFITVVSIIISVCLIVPQENSYKVSTNNQYEVTSYVNQLYVVVKKDLENGEMSEETKDTLNKVIDLDYFMSFKTGIDAHNCGLLYRENYTKEEYNAFKKEYKKLAKKYFGDVLKERITLFMQTSGFEKDINVHVDNTRIIYTRPANKAMSDFRTLYKTAQPLSLSIRNNVINILEGWNLNTNNINTNITFNIFYNVVPSIIIVTILCIICLIKRKWITLLTLGISLAKAFAIILTAPDTFFMYYLPIYIVGYFMLALIIALKIDKNENVKILN